MNTKQPGSGHPSKAQPGSSSSSPPYSGNPAALHRAPASARTVYLLDPVVIKDLAGALGVKPFKVVADLMDLKVFKSAEEAVDFNTAALVAQKHGFRAERPPPGMLVL